MLKFIQKKLKEEKGLTLIELLAVIVILAIIAAIAIPAIGGIIQNTREDAVVSDAQNALSAANLYFTSSNSGDDATVTVQQLVTDNYLETAGSLDADNTTITNSNPDTISGSGLAGTTTMTIPEGTTSAELAANGRDALEASE